METKILRYDQFVTFWSKQYDSEYSLRGALMKRLDETNLLVYEKKYFKIQRVPKIGLFQE